jgi:hypothetical protein
MRKPKKSDFKKCRDPEFAYDWAMALWIAAHNARTFLKLLKKLDSHVESTKK